MQVSNMYIPFSGESVGKEKNIKYKLSDGIACRDPFIMLYNNRYYMYKRFDNIYDLYRRKEDKIVVLVSDDLENWSEEITVYEPREDFHGIKDLFWAPECHYYKGHFYIFTSVFSNKTNHRSISVYRADNPLGPFEDIADGCITPPEWNAIDGTLYVDESGQPWMVFVREWVSMPEGNGSFVAAKLSEDFTHFIGEPIHLFYARELEGAVMGVTDGCYMVKLRSGKLMMLWSNFTSKGYVIAKAYSESGQIQGPWVQDGLLYEKGMYDFSDEDGGHAMIFPKRDGTMAITYHSPNSPREGVVERVQIRSIEEVCDTIKIKTC